MVLPENYEVVTLYQEGNLLGQNAVLTNQDFCLKHIADS